VTVTQATITQHDHLPRSVVTLRVATIAALILLVPWNIHFNVLIRQHSPHLAGSGVQSTLLGPVDALFILIIVLSAPLVMRRSTYLRQPAGQFGAAVSVVVVAIWLLMYPTVEGSMMLLRVLGVFTTVVVIRSMSRRDLMLGVVWSLSLGASFQALAALGQTLIYDTGMTVPATFLAEGRAWTAGRGTFSGSYALAAYLILAIAVILSFGIAKQPRNKVFAEIRISRSLRLAMWTTVVLSSSAVATTFGRTALLAIGLVGVTYTAGWFMTKRNIMGMSAVATLMPLAVTGLFLRSGWLVRATQSANLDFTTRDVLARRAIEMIRSHPLTGIGPVQYGPHLTRMGLLELDPHVVHNLPLLVSAEFGIVIGLAFTVWLVWLGVRAFKLSVFAIALFLSILPFFMLDNLHYVYGNGMAMFAVWLAMLDYNSDAAVATAESPERANVPDSQ
jgi:hypothetical protein